MDCRPATVQIDEWPTYPATPRQVLLGGFAEFSMSGQGAASFHSAIRNEEAPPPNLRSGGETSHHITVTPTISSSQGAPAAEIPMFWCHDCGIGFVQVQGFNRHHKDKHSSQNICPVCRNFVWSSARRYLFTRHLKRYHPEVVLADGWRRLGDGRRKPLGRRRLIPSTTVHT